MAKGLEEQWPDMVLEKLNQIAAKNGWPEQAVYAASVTSSAWPRLPLQQQLAAQWAVGLTNRQGKLPDRYHGETVDREVYSVVGATLGKWAMGTLVPHAANLYHRALRAYEPQFDAPLNNKRQRLLYLSSLVGTAVQQQPHELPQGHLIDSLLNNLLR